MIRTTPQRCSKATLSPKIHRAAERFRAKTRLMQGYAMVSGMRRSAIVQHIAWRNRNPKAHPYQRLTIEDVIVAPVAAAALAATAASERKMMAPATHTQDWDELCGLVNSELKKSPLVMMCAQVILFQE